MRAVATALAAVALLAAAPAPNASPANLTSAPEILRAMAATEHGLTSYQVPVTMKGSVKVKFISLPFSMSGTQYYQAPDKQALHMNDVPDMAKRFANQVATMGTPETWPQTYDIALQGRRQHGNHQAYVLVGTPRRGGNVKNVTFLVNPASYAIEDVAFAYNNGSKLDVQIVHHNKNPYHLPESAQIQADFPGYGGNATVTYGTYQTNVPIPASVFQQ